MAAPLMITITLWYRESVPDFKLSNLNIFISLLAFLIIIKMYTSNIIITINSLKPLFTNEKAEYSFASNNQDYNMQIIFVFCYS